MVNESKVRVIRRGALTRDCRRLPGAQTFSRRRERSVHSKRAFIVRKEKKKNEKSGAHASIVCPLCPRVTRKESRAKFSVFIEIIKRNLTKKKKKCYKRKVRRFNCVTSRKKRKSDKALYNSINRVSSYNIKRQLATARITQKYIMPEMNVIRDYARPMKEYKK